MQNNSYHSDPFGQPSAAPQTPIRSGVGDCFSYAATPVSPLSQLVQNGYPDTAAPGGLQYGKAAGGAPPHATGHSRPGSRQDGNFMTSNPWSNPSPSNLATGQHQNDCGGMPPRWSHDDAPPAGCASSAAGLRSGASRPASRQYNHDGTLSNHQSAMQSSGGLSGGGAGNHHQHNDPNFKGAHRPKGYRVTNAPGGGSSLSLNWGGDAGGGDVAAGGGGGRSPNYCEPDYSGRRGLDQQQSVGGGHHHHAAPPHDFSTGYGSSGASAGRGGGESNQSYSGGGNNNHIFGAQAASRGTASSNAYANGNNQNVGNFVSDRRTTKVLRPPGGASSISFG